MDLGSPDRPRGLCLSLTMICDTVDQAMRGAEAVARLAAGMALEGVEVTTTTSLVELDEYGEVL